MSEAWATMDLLHTAGNNPFSSRIPPFCPPIPKAQLLQAFLVYRARSMGQIPPARPDVLSEYRSAPQPPADFGILRFIGEPLNIVNGHELALKNKGQVNSRQPTDRGGSWLIDSRVGDER